MKKHLDSEFGSKFHPSVLESLEFGCLVGCQPSWELVLEWSGKATAYQIGFRTKTQGAGFKKHTHTHIPKHSMYGIFTYIYHRNWPFMQVNMPYIECLGLSNLQLKRSPRLIATSWPVFNPQSVAHLLVISYAKMAINCSWKLITFRTSPPKRETHMTWGEPPTVEQTNEVDGSVSNSFFTTGFWGKTSMAGYCWTKIWSINRNKWVFPKIGDFTPKMDGENNGKAY